MNRIFTSLFLAAIIILPVTSHTHAQSNSAVVYSRTVIAIAPKVTISDASAINESNSLQKEAATPPITTNRQRREIEVEVRNKQISPKDGILKNHRLDEEHGILTYFDVADKHVIMPEPIYQSVDILFVRDDGTIAQIVPDIMLAHLAEPLETDFALRALLYLRAEQAAQWNIRPGDRVEHGMFTPKPVIHKEGN